MADEPDNSANSAVKPYKEMEFEEFLKAIGNANIKNWSVLAEALGVDRNTLIAWRQHPLAQEALSTAIQESLKEMQESGKADWRMWREKAKILGVKDKSTLEHEVSEETREVLDKLERTDYGKLGQQITEQGVETNPPVQDKK